MAGLNLQTTIPQPILISPRKLRKAIIQMEMRMTGKGTGKEHIVNEKSVVYNVKCTKINKYQWFKPKDQ